MQNKFARTRRQFFAAGLIVITLCFASGDGQFAAHAQNDGGGVEGIGVGAIPDGLTGTPPQYGAPRVVSFPVTNLTDNVTSVSLNVTLAHTFIGDVDMVLQAPNGGPSLIIVRRIGVNTGTSFGDSSNYGGNYLFSDTANTMNIWTVATIGTCGDDCVVPSNPYRTTASGLGENNPPPVTSLNAAFVGLTPSQANGTWTLTLRDAAATDTGTITAAQLNIDTGAAIDVPLDMNGDGKTDYVTVRNTGAGASGATNQMTWFVNENGVTRALLWGIATDSFVPEDYDGDDKDDLAVWRPGAPNVAGFYILQSRTNTFRFEKFGQNGDDPSVVGDYDGDNRADAAVYRAGIAGQSSTWFYRPSATPATDFVGFQWGQSGDFPIPGDYDGDGKHDFVVQRNAGGQGRFFLNQSTAGIQYVTWGTANDLVVPGDYDGDRKCDIAVTRAIGNQINWFINERDGGTQTYVFGASATDFRAQGDYNGDGKIDAAVWRPSATPGASQFFARPSGTGGASDIGFQWGQNGDYPAAAYNQH